MDSGGDVYNPNGTPVSSGGSGSSGSGSSGSSASSGGSSGNFTAQDLMDAITAGDAGKIIELVSQSGGTASPETQTVSMSAEDLGLPSGGTVTLTVTGRGVSFSETRAADADGFVRFEVPKVETNSFVTIELSVQDSNGTIFWYGRDTQQVKEGGNLEVRIVRRFWTLPESLTVAVSPSAIAYNSTAPDSTSVTFSITNLDGAPDDAVFTYSWKDETGAEVGTGATLTRTAGQMLGAGFTPMNDSETRTYTVDVSYTDASGSTVTSSGSGTATIATAATLTVNAPGLQTEGDRYVLAVNKGTAVSFTAGVLCYGGTADYSWSPSGTAIGPVSGTGMHNENAGISPAAGGLSMLTVTATLADGRVLTKDIDVYVLDLTLSKGGSLLGASDPVFITDATGDIPSAALTAALDGLAGLSGVSYSWLVGSTSVATVSPAGSTPSATATVSSAAAGTTMVQVSASYKGVTTVPVSRPLCVVGLAVKESGTAVTGDLAMAKGAAAPASLTAEVSGYGSGVNYSWTVTGSSVTASGTSGTGNSLTPAAGGKSTLTVTATITANGMTLSKAVDVYVFDLNLSGSGLSAGTPAADYTLVTSTNDTSGVAVNASLAGTGMPSVSYSWTPGSGADTYIELNGSAAASRTVKPKAAGSATFTVGVEYGGTTVASKTVAVSVAGIVFTTFPKSYKLGSVAGNTIPLEAEVQGYSGSVTWGTWGSGTTTVASVGGGTNTATTSSTNFTAAAGGKTEITLSANVGGVALTAKKEIYVLDLTLSCTDTSFSPPTATANGSLTMASGDTAGSTVTANLAGLPTAGVSYTWTPPSSTVLSLTTSGTGNKNARLAPLTSASGTETVSVTAAYDGESITKSINVTVAKITLSGPGTFVFNSDPAAPAGANDIALILSSAGVLLEDLSSVSYESSNTLVAANPTATTIGNASGTVLKGGTTTITVRATAGGKELTATTDITVINLIVKDGAGHDVPATGNSLTDGPITLTAEFEDLDDGDFAWTCTPATGSDISISATSGPTTTVSGTSGTATVTLSASYGGTPCGTRTMDFSMIYTVAWTNRATLETYLNGITGTDAAHPAKVNVTGLTASDTSSALEHLRVAVQNNSSVYVDLSATTLPDDGLLGFDFANCPNLIVPPPIPAGVTTMYNGFLNCTGLTDVSGLSIPNSVTVMSSCFSGCTGLTDLSELTIPNSVTNMYNCFYGCTSLTTAPEIPANVTSMWACFSGCTNLTGSTIIINASITSNPVYGGWRDAFKNVTGVTVKVPDCGTKAAIEERPENAGVTVELISGGSCD